ncbi:MAG: protein BatD [Gammaproteobacteria bacterium]|nr:protein BatD [Gammaproteobacteria bacterium]
MQNSIDMEYRTNVNNMNKFTNQWLIFCLILSCFLFTGISRAATELSASVDRNPVMENESFVLQLVVNDSVDSDELDLSPLQQSGLLIGRSNTSSQTQIINGSISKSTTWNVVMLARNAGEYRIPALEINGVKSQPITVQVVKSNAQAGEQSQPIFLKNSIENDALYLQQTTKLVTRLYFAPNVDLQSGTLTDPSLDSAFIKQQGKDTETSEIIMGTRYRVIERIYAVTPQSSGEFTITSPTFNGEISTDRRRSVFSNFGSRKPVSSIGNDITITVAPIPDDYSGSWLPSDLVQLHEEWQPNKDSYEVGEPITRTFTLTALNVNEEQLPEIKGQYPSDFNMYPDQSESHSAVRQNAVVSQRVSSEAIVANKAGTYTLPEVTLNWFNTQTNRKETATIPAKTITIVASSSKNDNTLVSNIPLQSQSLENGGQQCPAPEVAQNEQEALSCPETVSLSINSWLLTLSGWIAWLITTLLLVLKLKAHRNRPQQSNTQVNVTEPQFDKSALKKGCSENNVSVVRSQLVLWAKEHISDEVDNLQSLLGKIDKTTELATEIRRLNQSQYGRQKTDWNGDLLWKAYENYARDTKVSTNKLNDDLPPLN